MQARRLRLLVILVATLLLAAIGIGTTLLSERLRNATREAADDALERTARVAESVINRHFLQVDGALAGLPAILGQLARDGRFQMVDVQRMLRDLNFQNLSYRDLLLVRPDGRPLATALVGSRRQTLPVDPAAFATPPRVGGVSIVGPARNPVTGEWSLFFARSMELPGQGQIFGVAEVPITLIATLLDPVGQTTGMRIILERADGTLLASLPHDEGRIGRPLSPSAREFQTDGRAFEMAGRITNETVLMASRPTLYRDIVVTASRDLPAVLAGWHADRRRLIAIAGTVGVMVLALALALVAALRQRERIDTERARARAVLESAIDSMSDGFVMFDPEDRLVACNQRYRDLYEVSAPFIRPGARFKDIIRAGAEAGQYPQAGADLESFVREITEWHRGNHPPLERLLPDGRWLLITERRMPDGGVVGIRTDITAFKRAMAELAAARDAASAATEAKTRFLARMSHELRTPLNGVLGLAQALAKDPALGPIQRVRAELLELAGRHLLSVANDVLDLSRVEAGELVLQSESMHLPALLEGCAGIQRPAAEAKSMELELRLDPSLPRQVLADPTRLRQLVTNLLSNAVKFTPVGGRLTLLARRVEPDPVPGWINLRIEVRDTGPGVPVEAREQVFGDFVQLELGDRAGGAGLGLAIAAHIVERMQGRIGCTDNPDGVGACFWAEIPLPSLDALPEPVAGPAAPTMRQLRLLVVDDVPANLAVATALLESAGQTAQCLGDGESAVAAVEAASREGRPYDAVLMDVMMPGIDGLEAARRIRALAGDAGRLPILAVTAGVFAEDIAACRAAGMDRHLSKPLERGALLLALAEVAAGPHPPETAYAESRAAE
jgi:signal transduction histidine kinase/FixJ family two-component response regulator